MIAPILAVVLTIAPGQAQPPSGPLPWPVPVLPPIPVSTPPAIVLGELEHSDTFDDDEAEIEGIVSDWSAPITSLTTLISAWLGPTGVLPDSSTGEFSAGVEPLDDVGTSNDVAHYLGSQIAVFFEYLRVAFTLPGDVAGALLTVMLICATVLVVIKVFDFGMSIFDAGWSFVTNIINLLGEWLPTGG